MAEVSPKGTGQEPLQSHDPELYELIQEEAKRQWSGLELIASEVSGPRNTTAAL